MFKKLKELIQTGSQTDLQKLIVDNKNLPYYNLGSNSNIGNLYNSLREVPEMLDDPIISSTLACYMETAFQTNHEQKVFWVKTPFSVIQKELDVFHAECNFQQLILNMGYNLLIWGNLPYEMRFDKNQRLIGLTPIPNFTDVTPIVISGILVGYLVNGEFKYPFEYVYAQLQYYKNLGGTTRSMSQITSNDGETIRNEFVLAPSYLSASAKPWRNIQLIEDALLLHRMDQSNYYRIISVDVGAAVYSKPAIRVLNYYRNLFKKVRRVSYDPSGMASRGGGQEFEVVIPKSGTSGIDIQNVGGEIEVKALADLDKQYQRLFASLRIQPSMIGFSEDTPSTLSGEGPAVLWDNRFAKACKTLVFSCLRAIHDIDEIYLKSRGYNVSADDWSYGTMATSVIDENDKSEALLKSVETFQKLTEQLKNQEVNYNKNYLVETILGASLSSIGVSVDELLRSPNSAKEPIKQGKPALGFTDAQRRVLVAQGFLSNRSSRIKKTQITSSIDGSLDINQIKSEYQLLPGTATISLDGFVNRLESSIEILSQSLSSRKPDLTMDMIEVSLPVSVASDVDTNITVADLQDKDYRCLSKVISSDKHGTILLSKEDLCCYLTYYLNDLNYALVNQGWKMK